MDLRQAKLTKGHLQVIQRRISSLENELQLALRTEEFLKKELDFAKHKFESLTLELKQKSKESESNYIDELEEYRKQNKLIEEMLAKKKEERKVLLDYLYSSKICDKLPNELRDFDWEGLKNVFTVTKKGDFLESQRQKILLVVDLNKTMRNRLSKINQLFSSTLETKKRNTAYYEKLKQYNLGWKQTNESQEKKIIKMQLENERLNLLIKQCVLTNEPISEYVTKNLREKCHSFLNTSSPDELVNGLTKYRSRQERIIQVFKHKEMKLARENNQLQIARDSTADQMQYYSNTIKTAIDLLTTNGPRIYESQN